MQSNLTRPGYINNGLNKGLKVAHVKHNAHLTIGIKPFCIVAGGLCIAGAGGVVRPNVYRFIYPFVAKTRADARPIGFDYCHLAYGAQLAKHARAS